MDLGCYWVVGTPAAGKSTLARELAATLDLRHVELDDPFWAAGWVPAEGFLDAVHALLAEPGWVVDGQYAEAVAAHVDRAHAVIWVDTPWWLSLPRLVRRTLARARRRQPLWSAGNRETWWHALGHRSVIWYAIAVHRAQRGANEELFRRLSSAGTRLIRVRRPDVTLVLGELSALKEESTGE